MRGGVGVGLAQEVLGGDRERGVAVRAKEKKHRVGKGVEREVSPVFGRCSGLEPREGQAAARIPCAQGPMAWGVAV